MSKDIVISEGAEGKIFSNVAKLKTRLKNSENICYWIPEDEAGEYAKTRLGTVTISENGTYAAEDAGYDGFSTVVVETAGGGANLMPSKSIASEGTYRAETDGFDGYAEVVVTLPGGGLDGGILPGKAGYLTLSNTISFDMQGFAGNLIFIVNQFADIPAGFTAKCTIEDDDE